MCVTVCDKMTARVQLKYFRFIPVDYSGQTPVQQDCEVKYVLVSGLNSLYPESWTNLPFHQQISVQRLRHRVSDVNRAVR